jgi:hypothetical protein
LARYAHLLDGFTCLTNAGTTNSTSGRSAQAVRYAKFGLPNRYVPDAIARCRHRDRCAESCPGSTTPHVTTHLSSRRQSSKPLRNIYLFKAHFKKKPRSFVSRTKVEDQQKCNLHIMLHQSLDQLRGSHKSHSFHVRSTAFPPYTPHSMTHFHT